MLHKGEWVTQHIGTLLGVHDYKKVNFPCTVYCAIALKLNRIPFIQFLRWVSFLFTYGMRKRNKRNGYELPDRWSLQ